MVWALTGTLLMIAGLALMHVAADAAEAESKERAS